MYECASEVLSHFGEDVWCDFSASGAKKVVKRSHLFRAYGRFLEQGVIVPGKQLSRKIQCV